jgi:predicted metal-dependent peptidase
MPPRKKIETGGKQVVIEDGVATILPELKTGDKKKRNFKVKSKNKLSVLPSQKQIEEKLTTARIGLLIREPFFGSMATRLIIIRDDNMQTASTDGRHFYYNLEFIANLTIKETEFLFGHEVLHNVFEHHLRKAYPIHSSNDKEVEKKHRHHLAWNIACDYAVNQILVDSKIGDKIDQTLLDPKYKNKCAEEIYDDLMQNSKTCDLETLAEMMLDEHMDALEEQGKGLSEEEKEQVRNEIKQSLLDSYQAAAGNVPSGVDRLVKGLTNPKISWRDELKQDIQSVKKYDYTFYKPARKGMSQGIVLPGMKRDEELDICVAIDCSGSIRDEDVAAFLSEIGGIMDQYDDYSIRVWSFDTKVYNDEVFRSDEGRCISEYKTKGGGGTSFECNWNYMKDNDIIPKLFIMFTDMQPCGGWGDETYCDDVLFVAYKAPNIFAPFGKTITMD